MINFWCFAYWQKTLYIQKQIGLTLNITLNIIFLIECHCNEDGSVDTSCDEASGKCTCKEHIVGDKCTQCVEEFHGFPNCEGNVQYFCKMCLLIDSKLLFFMFL